ncbi:hypothetical protein AVEN_264533-1 [Araneus ventricosus]|uniref:STPR domain-containing protein n=1 Tax=Araneus ventricosus TaxID=182803 RepID=A0A4Y2G9C5_ARAVE|nr:hypothetical protein AVEN_264533-1 [Araneus ventricosus]
MDPKASRDLTSLRSGISHYSRFPVQRRVMQLDRAAGSCMTQRGQRRRAEETDEQRNSRLAVMAQRGQMKRAEETDEQRNSRLSAMLQHARERRLNVIEGQNHHQIQTFYAARTVLN